jgi:hypothetical protein
VYLLLPFRQLRLEYFWVCLPNEAEQANNVGIVINTFAFGLGPALLSFMTSLVHKNDTAFLYMVLTVIGTLGALAGLPAMGLALSEGIHLGGTWIGLPYLVAAGSMVLCLVIVLGVQVPKKNQRVHESEHEDEGEE